MNRSRQLVRPYASRRLSGVSPTDEANVAVETLRVLRPLLPGPHFHVHDGAMTSEHNQALLTELGTVLINRTRAKKNPKIRGRAIGQREADEGLVEVKETELADGEEEALLIHQVDSELGLLDLTEIGSGTSRPWNPRSSSSTRTRGPGLTGTGPTLA